MPNYYNLEKALQKTIQTSKNFNFERISIKKLCNTKAKSKNEQNK